MLLLVLLFGVGCAIAAGAWVYDAVAEGAEEFIAEHFEEFKP